MRNWLVFCRFLDTDFVTTYTKDIHGLQGIIIDGENDTINAQKIL